MNGHVPPPPPVSLPLRCPGPQNVIPGAIFDPAVDNSKRIPHPDWVAQGGTVDTTPGKWINNPHWDSVQFCEHGYQYSHLIEP